MDCLSNRPCEIGFARRKGLVKGSLRHQNADPIAPLRYPKYGPPNAAPTDLASHRVLLREYGEPKSKSKFDILDLTAREISDLIRRHHLYGRRFQQLLAIECALVEDHLAKAEIVLRRTAQPASTREVTLLHGGRVIW